MFVEVTTDTGLKGVGESTFFGFPEATASVARSMGTRLIGEDPFRIEYHNLSLYRALSMRGMAIGGAISAIDQALWDIKGKHFQAPVWELLGGRVRDKVRAMLVIPYGTAEEVAAACKQAADEGYTALKVMVYQPEHHRRDRHRAAPQHGARRIHRRHPRVRTVPPAVCRRPHSAR
jgi:galactonate dehydratase